MKPDELTGATTSRAAVLRDLIMDRLPHEAAITEFAKQSVAVAKNFIPHLAFVPAGVLDTMPTLMLAAIQTILEHRMTDKIMPTWLIQHTVIQATGKTPISAIMLRSLEQPTEAKATLVGAELVGGQVSAREKYPKTFPVAQLWPRGRVIDGPTQPEPDASAFPEELPTNLWEWVAAKQRPVIWSDAWPPGETEFPSSAFRALLPYRSVEGSKRQVASKHRQSYVAALRVEVYPIG